MVKVKNKKSVSFDGHGSKKDLNKKKTVNPFEVHFNKEKFQVLGRKNKNDKGLPGVSRAKALKKRKNTLGLEYLVKYKDNKFVDRRIGEQNSVMTYEDRINARFTAERVKQQANRKDIYKLADDEVLTHRGQTLEEIEKFEDIRSDDELSDDENRPNGRLEDKFVAEAHFGGGLFRNTKEEGVKSRKDIIEQLIVESKKRKVEKQKEREVTLEMTEKLDSEWKDLLPLVNKKSESEKNSEEKSKPKVDDYDMLMRQLIFEPRGTPTDRLKSQEDIAKQEEEKLKKLENDRIARMHGENTKKVVTHRSADDLDDGFNLDDNTETILTYDDDGNMLTTFENENVNKEDDSIDETDENPNKTDKISKDEDDSNDENTDSSSDDDDDDDDEDVDSLNDLKDESSESEEEEEVVNKKLKKELDVLENLNEKPKKKRKHNEIVSDTTALEKMLETLEKKHKNNDFVFENDKRGVLIISSPVQKVSDTTKEQKKVTPLLKKNEENTVDKIKSELLERKISMEKAARELPYTYKMPEKCEDLEELLIDQPADHQGVILERILKCNHPSLAPTNKEKLETLMTYLLQYVNDRFTDVCELEELENSFKILDRITPHLYDLCKISPQNAYTCFIEIIKEKQDDFKKNSKKYPGLETLVFLKLISLLFPTSDFRHQVVTPAVVFISQMLSRCRVRTASDISYGLFLVTLTIEWGVLSNRFLPAVTNFIWGVLHMAVPKNWVRLIKVIPPFKSVGEFNQLLVLEDTKTSSKSPELILKASDFLQQSIDESFKIRAVHATLNLLVESFNYLKTSSACQAIFAPHIRMLELIPKENYPEEIRKQIDRTLTTILSCNDIKIENIVMEKKRPKTLRLYEPTIVQVFDTKRRKNLSQQEAERAKLVHKLKQERKGAIREIRRDKDFIANLKIKKQIQSDIERKVKVNKIFAEASEQQCEFNKMTRTKENDDKK